MAVFAAVDDANSPLTGLTPTFLGAWSSETLAAVAAPTITEIDDGFYSFPDTPTLIGMIDLGTASAVPRYIFVGPDALNAFPVWEDAAPLTGATPTFVTYQDEASGADITPLPTIVELGNGVYAFTPASTTDNIAITVATGGAPGNISWVYDPSPSVVTLSGSTLTGTLRLLSTIP